MKRIAEGGIWSNIRVALIMLTVIIVVLLIFKGFAEGSNKTLTKLVVEQKLISCKASVQTYQLAGIPISYCGSEIYPMNCNPCLGAKEWIDKNNNFMADECEETVNDNTGKEKQIKCKFYYDKNKDQCCTKSEVDCGLDAYDKPNKITCSKTPT